MPFPCSICDEPATQICVACTKDTCANHLCLRCHRCSDCCECEEPMAESTTAGTVAQPPPPPPPEPAAEPAAAPGEELTGQADNRDLT